MGKQSSLSTPRVDFGTMYFVTLLREDLGARIKVARVAAGLSQQDLAVAAGLKHAQDISRYERGKVDVPAFRIDLIAEATGRPRSYFVRDPSEPEPISDDRIIHLEEQVEALRQGQNLVLELLREIRGNAEARSPRRTKAN